MKYNLNKKVIKIIIYAIRSKKDISNFLKFNAWKFAL